MATTNNLTISILGRNGGRKHGKLHERNTIKTIRTNEDLS